MNGNWEKIEKFEFEKSPQEYSFETRLAYENSWTIYFTKKAILEYKKFMYLVAKSDQMLSPSKIIDIVWYQHLIYSESYAKFCIILEKKIKHIPSTHNAKEESSFINSFKNTEILYKEIFDPLDWDFWKINHSSDLLNLSFKKKIISNEIILLVCILVFFIVYFSIKPLLLKIDNPQFLFGYIFITVTSLFFLKKHLQSLINQFVKNEITDNFTIFEILALKNQSKASIDIVIKELINENQIKLVHENAEISYKRISKTVYEKAVRNCFLKTTSIPYYKLYKSLKSKNCFLQHSKSTKKIQEIIFQSYEFKHMEWVTKIVFSGLLILGLCRYFLGISRDKPIILLNILLIIFIVYFWYFFNRYLKKLIPNSLFYTHINQKNKEDQSLGWAFLLIGPSVFGSDFKQFTTYNPESLQNSNNYSSSCSSSGSSCSSGGSDSSGSSCGSSCGGCGGGD